MSAFQPGRGSSPPLQLHLPVELRREPTLAEYHPGPNAEALAAVAASASGCGEPFLFLFGASGTGKSHLLQGACLAAQAQGRRAHYVALAQAGLAPAILEDLERLDLVAVDDVNRIAGQADWECALFDLFNRLRECQRVLVVAANEAPDRLALGLADLRSRLHWGPRYRLLPLPESDCEALLTATARRRGLILGPELVRYVMTRHARDPQSLLNLVERIDSASLREQRQPSIPLVKKVMSGEI